MSSQRRKVSSTEFIITKTPWNTKAISYYQTIHTSTGKKNEKEQNKLFARQEYRDQLAVGSYGTRREDEVI